VVHTLLDEGLGLLECARRLGWALNTVKRYARAATAEQLQRPPRYRATLVDPYRDHLRRRLAEEPGVAVTRLLAEIREQGYPGSANLLVRYLKRAAPTRPPRPEQDSRCYDTESCSHERRHHHRLCARAVTLTDPFQPARRTGPAAP
jgi:transposase